MLLLEFCWRTMCWNWWCRFVCCAAKFCFAAATEPPAANWYSLPICVLRSEILFRCRNWTCCSELIFAADLCIAQQNSVSLPRLNLLQRIDIRCRFVCCAVKFYFAAETEPPTVNRYSLLSCALCSETVVPTAVQFLLPNWQPAANQFSLPNWAARSEPVLAADSYNKPPRQEWLKC